MIAEALIVSAGDPDRFLQSFAGRLRWWLFSFPPAIGLATLHALLKLWAGFPPDKSGVFFAGNGPAMRSAILGVCYGDDPRAIEQMMSSNRLKPYLTVRAVQGLEGIELAPFETRISLFPPFKQYGPQSCTANVG